MVTGPDKAPAGRGTAPPNIPHKPPQHHQQMTKTTGNFYCFYVSNVQMLIAVTSDVLTKTDSRRITEIAIIFYN